MTGVQDNNGELFEKLRGYVDKEVSILAGTKNFGLAVSGYVRVV
ncbi:MAG TPA: hypothetical protein VJA47_02175 [archaeon]|nr:hypothetical protein [archaeon]